MCKPSVPRAPRVRPARFLSAFVLLARLAATTLSGNDSGVACDGHYGTGIVYLDCVRAIEAVPRDGDVVGYFRFARPGVSEGEIDYRVAPTYLVGATCAITIEFEPTPRADDLSASDLPPGKVVQLAQEVADQCSATAHLGGYITSDIISIQDPLGSRKEHRIQRSIVVKVHKPKITKSLSRVEVSS